MAKRGRPRLKVKSVRQQVNLRLRPGEDDDLIAFFASIPDGMCASALKAALRAGGMQIEDCSEDPADPEEMINNFLF